MNIVVTSIRPIARNNAQFDNGTTPQIVEIQSKGMGNPTGSLSAPTGMLGQ
jgi:hypothetical protein